MSDHGHESHGEKHAAPQSKEHHEKPAPEKKSEGGKIKAIKDSAITNTTLFFKRLAIFLFLVLLVIAGADIVTQSYNNMLSSTFESPLHVLPGDTLVMLNPLTMTFKEEVLPDTIIFRDPISSKERVISRNEFPQKNWKYIAETFFTDWFIIAWKKFVNELKNQPHPLLKILLILKALALTITMGLTFGYYFVKCKAEAGMIKLLVPLKLIIVLQFLIYGCFQIYSNFDSLIVYDFGGMFNPQVIREEFIKNKLAIITTAMLIMRDVFNLKRK